MTAASPSSVTTAARSEGSIAPRRFGHANLYVGDLTQSFAFYHDVLGLELVFDEPGISALFLSNGNSHHDIALMQASNAEMRGRDGRVQVSSERGAAPGLNHLALEMRTERDLVRAIRHMRSLGHDVVRLFDHQVSRSAYFSTPWAADIELYADRDRDWRRAYASLDGELLTERWEPDDDLELVDDVERFVIDLDHRPVAGAPAQPLRTASATVAVTSIDEAVRFFGEVVGMTAAAVGPGWAVLAGSERCPDLGLVQMPGSEGLHHVTLELPGDELDVTVERLGAAGVPIEWTLEHELARRVLVRDPDGVAIVLSASAPGVDAFSYAPLDDVDPRFVL